MVQKCMSDFLETDATSYCGHYVSRMRSFPLEVVILGASSGHHVGNIVLGQGDLCGLLLCKWLLALCSQLLRTQVTGCEHSFAAVPRLRCGVPRPFLATGSKL